MTGKNSYTFIFSYFIFENIWQRKEQKFSDIVPVFSTSTKIWKKVKEGKVTILT